VDRSVSPAGERPPDWTWDETVLAWDLYLREYASPLRYPVGTDAVVVALSEELRALPIHPERARRLAQFRNPAGVARKIQNLMFCHTGRYGSAHASSVDRAVVERLPDVALAQREASAILAVSAALDAEPATGEDEFAVHEGTLLPRFHLVRERNAGAVRRKKQQALKSGRPITCEVCGIEVAAVYGVADGAVVECHHRAPLAEGPRQTRLADLALVCPTCHRVLHRVRPWTSVEDLAQRVRERRSEG
jgi:5-methylcytosine-specific restriction protein A